MILENTLQGMVVRLPCRGCVYMHIVLSQVHDVLFCHLLQTSYNQYGVDCLNLLLSCSPYNFHTFPLGYSSTILWYLPESNTSCNMMYPSTVGHMSEPNHQSQKTYISWALPSTNQLFHLQLNYRNKIVNDLVDINSYDILFILHNIV